MAPEIIRGDSYNASADVFSYGCVLWEIGAKRNPDVLHENPGASGPFLSQLLKMWEQGATLQPGEDWHGLYRELIPQCLLLEARDRPTFDGLGARCEAKSVRLNPFS